ncbi:lipocalin family protein [Flavobacterium sp.]|jgi:hypothetical protein|uniref:lipocalin family protein n=1 Tax=Flavobacterium sp. TaxID=239 RepID=UPI0037C11505
MKKTILLFVSILFLGLSLNSCDSDDSGSSTSGNIVGKWEFSKQGTIVSGSEVLTNYEHASCGKDSFRFLADNSMIDYYYEDNPTNGFCYDYTDEATWTKDGNTITINYGAGDVTVAEILILNETTLKVKSTDEFGEISIAEFIRRI